MNFSGIQRFHKSHTIEATLPPRPRLESLRSYFPRVFFSALLVAAGYYIGTLVGFALTPRQEPIAAFWPPNAILLAAFLITPRKQWWFFVLTVLPAHLLVQLPRGIPVGTSFGWFFGNIGEALLGAFLITEVQDARTSFESVRGLMVFLAFGVFGAPLLTSFVDAGVVIATGWGKDFWRLWTTRLLSNTLAELTIVPTVVLLRVHGLKWNWRASWTRYIEAALLGTAVGAISSYGLFSRWSGQGQLELFYILLLLLSWAALRFEFASLTATLLAVCLISSWSVVHGHPSFLAPQGNVVPLQVFLLMVALPSMSIAVVLVQQRETANSLRESRNRLVNSQEEERSRIARELHDDVGQLLALLEIELAQLGERCTEEIKGELELLGSRVSEISRVTREISHGLHPSQLEYLGLPSALERLCQEFSRDRLLDVHFDKGNAPSDIDSDISLSLYRVAQEALHNAAKYSRARHVEVRLQLKSGRLWLEVNDDGIGFGTEEKASNGMGLLNMRERMESIEGTFSIRSARNKGTRVHASVRLRKAA